MWIVERPIQAKMSSTDRIIDTESAEIAKSVQNLLLRKGIQKRGQSKKIQEILGLSLSQAHKKLNGSSNWDLAQIRQVADYFGEPFNSLNTMFAAPTSLAEEVLLPAKFCIEARELPCLVCIGAPLHTIKNVNYVASKTKDDQWRVIEAVAAQDNAVAYHKVKKLEISVKQDRQLSVAVLDDNEVSADNLCDFLLEIGFHAEAFYDKELLAHEIEEKPFDAYIIDWLIGQTTAESLIQLIRAKEGHPAAPIFLLTGELTTGRAHESEVARVLVEYDVSIQEKPTRLPIIAAELSKALGTA